MRQGITDSLSLVHDDRKLRARAIIPGAALSAAYAEIAGGFACELRPRAMER
jgi:hypothetical protein